MFKREKSKQPKVGTLKRPEKRDRSLLRLIRKTENFTFKQNCVNLTDIESYIIKS